MPASTNKITNRRQDLLGILTFVWVCTGSHQGCIGAHSQPQLQLQSQSQSQSQSQASQIATASEADRKQTVLALLARSEAAHRRGSFHRVQRWTQAILRRADVAAKERKQALLLSARAHAAAGQLAKAEARYRTLLFEETSPPRTGWLELASTLDVQSRYMDAAKVYTQALQAYPDDIEMLHELGLTWLLAGKPHDAIAPLRQAAKTLAAKPSPLAQAQQQKLHLLRQDLGHALLVVGQNQLAEDLLSAEAQAHPRDPHTLGLWIRALLSLGQAQKAQRIWLAACSDIPATGQEIAVSLAGQAQAPCP